MSFNNKTLAIITSDIHLGDLYCKTSEFEAFLTRILQDLKSGKLSHLEMLIFLGDTFDIIMNSFRNICNNPIFNTIYDLLQSINANGVSIIFVFGNHEMSTTGYYNVYFKTRKMEFLNNMKKNGFDNGFLKKDFICQYLLLGKGDNTPLTLSLYDSANKMTIGQNGELILTNHHYFLQHGNNFNEKYYFMTHGYQFENWGTHHFNTSPWWNIFMNLNENSKRGINEFWHKWSSEKEDFDYNSFYRYLESQRISKTRFRGGHIKKFIQNEIFRKHERFFDNAEEFLKNMRLNFITNIIFGHIHDALQVRYGNIMMTTNGCWLQNKQSHFTEILTNGDYIVKEMQ